MEELRAFCRDVWLALLSYGLITDSLHDDVIWCCVAVGIAVGVALHVSRLLLRLVGYSDRHFAQCFVRKRTRSRFKKDILTARPGPASVLPFCFARGTLLDVHSHDVSNFFLSFVSSILLPHEASATSNK